MLTVVLAVTVILVISWLFSSPFYWKKKGVPSITPWPLIGNAFKMLRLNTHEFIDDLYCRFPNERFFGFYLFTRPVLMLKDPELVVNILRDNESHFSNKGFQPDSREVLSHSLSDANDPVVWRYLNEKVSPHFSPDALDDSIPCTAYSIDALSSRLNEKIAFGGAMDIADLFSRYAIDLFMVSVLGVDTDVHKKFDSQFMVMKEEMLGKFYKFKYYFNMVSPKLYKFFKCCLIPTYVVLYVKRLIIKIQKHREENNPTRQDFIQGMFNLMKEDSKHYYKFDKLANGKPRPECDELFMAAQLLSLYPGGTEALGIVLTMCMYEIGRKTSIQDQIIAEIYQAVREEGVDINQKFLEKLRVTGLVIDEALRLYPPYVALFRECTKAYKIPGTEITLDVGTLVCVPVYSLHHDPKFHKYPDVFEPQRFTFPITPGSYLPFGMGSRKCMGIHFTYFQLKLTIFNLITGYSFRVHQQFQLELSTSRFFLQPKQGVDMVIFPLTYMKSSDKKDDEEEKSNDPSNVENVE